MATYGADIYWRETVDRKPAEPLRVATKADVTIVGGGFTGLWTALALKERSPTLDVILLEAAHIGFGASGRNGGFAMTLLDMSLTHLARNHGDQRARAAHEAVATSVDAIGAACATHGIDCDYHRGGLLVVATNEAQQRRVDADLATATRLGLRGFSALDGESVRAQVRSPTYLSALREEHCATVNPAKLATGLGRILEGLGVRVFENTPALNHELAGNGIRVLTPEGSVRTEQLVLAQNAWAHDSRPFQSRVVPLYSYIVATEPLSPAQWATVGWQNREGIEDKRNFVHYYRATADGRILWGGSDCRVYPRADIAPQHDANPGIFRQLESTFRRTFPQLDAVTFTHRWGGPVGLTVPFVPYFGSLPGGRIHYGHGYNGHGVAPAHTGGTVLADLVLEAGNAQERLFFVGGREPRFPPQPLLYAGAELTRRSLLAQDGAMDRGEDAGDMDPWLLRVMNRLS